MATYSFSTITAAQALAVVSGDTIILDTAPANQTTVLFPSGSTNQISVEAAGRTVLFGAGGAGATKTALDGSMLITGTLDADGPLSGGAGNDALYGGAGDDALSGAAGADLLQGNQGADTLAGQTGDDVIYGGQDNDLLDSGDSGGGVLGHNFAQGNRGDDTIVGGEHDSDILLGGQGNDVLGATARGPAGPLGSFLRPVGSTPGGGDILNGNLGNDLVFGTGGDTLMGEDGNDALFGVLRFDSRAAVLDGGAGNDTIGAQNGVAVITAGAGNDLVGYQNGAFNISLGDGDDRCGSLAPVSGDRLTIDGGAGNDIIDGSDGSDTINGGSGADTIDGFGGADTVAGGGGTDQFQFFFGEALTNLATLDQIVDWASDDHFFFAQDDIDAPVGAGNAFNYVESTAGDYASALLFANAQVANGVVNYVAVQVGADVFVFADTGLDNGVADSAVLLVGRTLSDISLANFDTVTAVI